MTYINLLPWRDQARKEQKKRFAIILGGIIGLAWVFVFFVYLFYSSLVNGQKQRNAYLQSELDQEAAVITILTKKEKEAFAIDADLHFLISLRDISYRSVRLLDELARVVPDGILFNKIVREKNHIMIFGTTNSDLQITVLMENLAKSAIFANPKLAEISAKEEKSGDERTFQVSVEQNN